MRSHYQRLAHTFMYTLWATTRDASPFNGTASKVIRGSGMTRISRGCAALGSAIAIVVWAWLGDRPTPMQLSGARVTLARYSLARPR